MYSGDSEYSWMSRPIALTPSSRDPGKTSMASRINRHHAKALSVIERTYGIKTTWRAIFFKALKVRPAFAAKVDACCALLHNFCLSSADMIEPLEEALDQPGGASMPARPGVTWMICCYYVGTKQPPTGSYEP